MVDWHIHPYADFNIGFSQRIKALASLCIYPSTRRKAATLMLRKKIAESSRKNMPRAKKSYAQILPIPQAFALKTL